MRSTSGVEERSKVVLQIDAVPFKGLKISDDWKKLDDVESRSVCSACKKSRKYFCYTCHIPVPEIIHFVPRVKLPVKVDVIKHAREMDGKSTAVHAAVLAPEDVRIFTYPDIPDYPTHENVVLIYPNPNAVSVEDVLKVYLRSQQTEPTTKRLRLENNFTIHRAVFIDSTWNQSRGILKDPRIKKLPSVVLKNRLSQFWRHQEGSPRWYLATVEAIHQFLLELDRAQWTVVCRETARRKKLEVEFVPASADAEKGSEAGSTTCHGKACSEHIIGEENCANVKGGLRAGSNIPDAGSTCSAISSVKSENTNSENKDSVEKNGGSRQSCVIREEGSPRSEYVYNGQYDNLLFFFRFMYSKIHTLYDHDKLKSYKRRLE